MFKIYTQSVRQCGPMCRDGSISVVIGEAKSLVYEGNASGAINALGSIPIGSSVAIGYPGGLRSCMNKPSLVSWLKSFIEGV
jgi:hypothetical protein